MRSLLLVLTLIVLALPHGAMAMASAPQAVTLGVASPCSGIAVHTAGLSHRNDMETHAAMQTDATMLHAAACPDAGSCTLACVAVLPRAELETPAGRVLHGLAVNRDLPAESHFPFLRPPIS